jgi:putative oxidoreductase
MNSLQLYGLTAARVLVGVVFLATGFGIIPQAPATKALADHGAPGALVPLLMLAGRTIEIAGGFGLILGIYPQTAAIAVIAFLIPATLVGHGFWQVRGTPTYIPQLLQFLKNAAMTGGSCSLRRRRINRRCFRVFSSHRQAGKAAAEYEA